MIQRRRNTLTVCSDVHIGRRDSDNSAEMDFYFPTAEVV